MASGSSKGGGGSRGRGSGKGKSAKQRRVSKASEKKAKKEGRWDNVYGEMPF